MTLIYVGELVLQSREDTQNLYDIPTATSKRGITDEAYVRYLNYAQESIERQITAKYPNIMFNTAEIAITEGVNKYSLPDNVYLGLRIGLVQYSRDGKEENFVTLYQKPDLENDTSSGTPYAWHREGPFERDSVQIVVEPIPTGVISGAKLRVRYQRAIDRLSLRIGQITSVTVAGGLITAITLNNSTALTDQLNAAALNRKPLCIVSPEGIPVAYNLIYTGYNSLSGVVTLATPYKSPILSTRAPQNNDYITLGEYATTHCTLPQSAQSYLIEYCNRRIKKREASKADWRAIDQEVAQIAFEISNAYAMSDSTTPKPIALTGWAKNMLTIDGVFRRGL